MGLHETASTRVGSAGTSRQVEEESRGGAECLLYLDPSDSYGSCCSIRRSNRPLMNVTVKLFAGLRERAGAGEVDLVLPEGATVSEALTALVDRLGRKARIGASTMSAVNNEYVTKDHELSEGDELALIPPVSGGAIETAAPFVEITDRPLDPAAVSSHVRDEADGAVLVFEGVTRNHSRGRRVLYLEYEAYRPMADEKIRELIGRISQRWDIDRVAVAHRVGRVEIGETSLVVAVSASHRRPAFEAGLYFVDRLKEVVPIWKKEFFEGGEVWINDEDPSGRLSGSS